MSIRETYKNRAWLEEQYIERGKSTTEIARECGCSQPTIRYQLRKFDIQTRPRGNPLANHIIITDKLREILYGNLLGDGSLSSQNSVSARYLHSSKYKSVLTKLSLTLAKHGIEQSGKIRTRQTHWGTVYQYQSKYYRELKPIQQKWYPNGKKTVPLDLELMSTTCLYWYIGDGTYNKKYHCIYLATDGFIESGVDRLVALLNEREFKSTKNKGAKLKDGTQSCKIRISSKSVSDFLNYIGPCPFPEYEYKWGATLGSAITGTP